MLIGYSKLDHGVQIAQVSLHWDIMHPRLQLHLKVVHMRGLVIQEFTKAARPGMPVHIHNGTVFLKVVHGNALAKKLQLVDVLNAEMGIEQKSAGCAPPGTTGG